MRIRSRFLGVFFSLFVLPIAASGCSSCASTSSDLDDPASSPSSSPQRRGEDPLTANRLEQPKNGNSLPPAQGLGWQIGRRAPDASAP